jgi:tetratricopeptide (TPR) repeat protein
LERILKVLQQSAASPATQPSVRPYRAPPILDLTRPEALSNVQKLAYRYFLEGRLDETLELYESLVEALRRTLPDNHPDIDTIQSRMGNILLSQGHKDRALRLLEKVLKHSRDRNDGSCVLLTDVHNVGNAYMDLGRIGEAQELFEEVLEIAKRPEFESNEEAQKTTLNSKGNLAIIYGSEHQRYEQGIQLLEEILETERNIHNLDETGKDVLSTRIQLASLYALHNRVEEAMEIFKDVLEKSRHTLGARHEVTVAARTYLLKLFLMDKQDGEALLLHMEGEIYGLLPDESINRFFDGLGFSKKV